MTIQPAVPLLNSVFPAFSSDPTRDSVLPPFQMANACVNLWFSHSKALSSADSKHQFWRANCPADCSESRLRKNTSRNKSVEVNELSLALGFDVKLPGLLRYRDGVDGPEKRPAAWFLTPLAARLLVSRKVLQLEPLHLSEAATGGNS